MVTTTLRVKNMKTEYILIIIIIMIIVTMIMIIPKICNHKTNI